MSIFGGFGMQLHPQPEEMVLKIAIFCLTLQRRSRKLKDVKLGDRLGVRRQVLALQTKVRILVPQPLHSKQCT